MGREYYLGLDMGTGSLGWAVTDSKYQLFRAHGKDLWGIRLFETAKTAEERRQFRCGRRRLDRRNKRIDLLQEIFAEEINKVDPGFFLRLKESKYLPEDKRDADGKTPLLPYALFVDHDYTDKDFHRQYPTIYHLRQDLRQNREPKDVRLVYLALHHIIKHRGHFLFPNLEADDITDFSAVYDNYIKAVGEAEIEFTAECDKETREKVKAVLEDSHAAKSDKAKKLCGILEVSSKSGKELLKLITGCKVKLSDIFGENYAGTEPEKLSFSEAAYEEYAETLESELGEYFRVIEAAKALYDWTVLVHILGGEKYISDAKVKLYEKHREDLLFLKTLVRQELTGQDYKKIFVLSNSKAANYCAYIGMTKVNGRKTALEGKHCSKEDFYAFLKKEVCAKIPASAQKDKLLKELELGTFMPRQTSKDNSVIPYQIHLAELRIILKNACNYLAFLNEKKEKIEQIMTFRVPYYVGPLGAAAAESQFAWAVRKKDGAVYPWNFEEMIDTEASAERFIRRMTNKCTYLVSEDVLPKESLLYSKFMVLNELNNLCIDGEKISVEIKQRIYDALFKRFRRVTGKKLKDYLVREGIASRDAEISGIDGDFKASLKAYHDFKEITGLGVSEEDQEKLILDITLFGEDKKLLSKRVKKMYPHITDGQLKMICKLQYKGWGRLSRKFLEEITSPDRETGEAVSIIRAMWETNENLMQLLSKRYFYIQAVEEANGNGECAAVTYELVQDLYVSTAVKRQIWQTLQVVKELQKVMKGAPERIFLEVAREAQQSGRTQSRKNKLLGLYQNCKTEERDWIGELDKREEHTLKSDRLFLYYTQKGHCMYCGKKIDLEELWDSNVYDIDHIYPQSRVMDDSIRNRVLTCRTCNMAKSDTYPLRGEVREKMRPFWHSLYEGQFIEEEKYKRLIRSEGFTAEELAGFIERQLVETRQSTKAVADILKRAMPETEIVYVKAKTVSSFRQDFDFVKVREVNDLHHAKDAYLNIVVGNTYYVKFNKDAARFIEHNPDRSYNLKRMFTCKDITNGSETAWRVGECGSIATVRKVMRKNSVLFTRRSYEAQGALFDQQLMKKGKGQAPVKAGDDRLCSIEKYGGYNKVTGAYFVLVESEGKKGILKRTLEYIPVCRKAEFEDNEERLLEYLSGGECNLKHPRILLRKIKIDTLFDLNGFKMHLSGRTGKQLIFKGANQLLLNEGQIRVVKKLVKAVDQIKENKNYKINNFDGLIEGDLTELYDTFLDKLRNTIYKEKLESQIKTLEDGRERFAGQSMEDKCRILYEILHLFQCNSSGADLSGIGGPGHGGILVLSNEVSKCDNIAIVNQSPTGIFEQVIDLKGLDL